MSMLRNLATSLINAEKEHIVTTTPKAKELRPFIEKAITLAKKAANLEAGEDTVLRGVHLRRQASRFFHAGNSTFKAEQSRFRGNKGEPKDKIERTAGVKAVQRLFDELGEPVTKTAMAATRALSNSAAVRATTPKWPLSNLWTTFA